MTPDQPEVAGSATPQKLKGSVESFISLLGRWYESYVRLLTLMASGSIALLGFSATFIVKDFLSAEEWRHSVPSSEFRYQAPRLMRAWGLTNWGSA
jgi:hypothetical protein